MTAYDAQGFLISNGAKAYSIGHRALVPVADPGSGATVLHIQYERPDASVNEANWLPIGPDGTFTLMLRLYAPQTGLIAPEGTWAPPKLARVTDN
ncbi:DUF1214 domain-containing protein [Streptomyces sp. NPDC048659]|uniref:DUF1214 domain-containing protein n=1 Tax=Streptomyces sp. NPDC048659 TaxID=3155489 RepID=UPI00343E609F